MKLGIDIVGNIVILKFDRHAKISQKKKVALRFLKEHKSVGTVLDYGGKFLGRLRTHKTKWIVGDKTKEALYKENGCVFRFNVDTCYFSPRLGNERKELAKKVKRNESVLVMFGGVGVYGIVIAKLSGAKRVVSVEISKECNKYAKINVKRNKATNFLRKKVSRSSKDYNRSPKRSVADIVEVIQGDVRRVVPKMKEKFDRIVMARPNLKDSFLDVAFKRIKKKGIVHYYGFYQEKDVKGLRELVNSEAKKARKKIKILKVKKAGDIGPYRFRYRVDLKVLN